MNRRDTLRAALAGLGITSVQVLSLPTADGFTEKAAVRPEGKPPVLIFRLTDAFIRIEVAERVKKFLDDWADEAGVKVLLLPHFVELVSPEVSDER